MKRGIVLALIICSFFSTQAQNYWKTYRESDGLADRDAKGIAVYQGEVFVATDSGLSVLKDGVFTNYDTSNSSLPSDNIEIIRNFKDTVWMATDSGLTEFVGGQMTHYSDTNGLLSIDITDMEVDSKGNLWIASFAGLTKKSGSVFTQEPGRKIYNIAINAGDSVYANVGFESIVNVATPVTAELFDGTAWTTLRDTSLNPFINKATFVNLNDTIVGVLSNEGRVFIVDSLFKLRESALPDSLINNTFLSDMVMDAKGNIWYSFAPNQFPTFVVGGIYRFDGTNYDFFSTGLPASRVYDIEIEGDVVYLATENGISFAIDTIVPIKSGTYLETNSIRVRINADGTLFRTDDAFQNAGDAGFNYPKQTDKNLIYFSGLWMSEESDTANKKLAVQRYNRGDFSIGTVNNNGNLVGQTMIEIAKTEIDFHLQNYTRAGYVMPESIKNWPGNGRADFEEGTNQAPFVDVNNNGCYDPEQGDYPHIIGDKAVYLVINDAGNPNSGQPIANLNTEVQILAYVFNQPNIDYLDKTLFVRYLINNRSDTEYKNLKTGFFYDFDLGGFSDDYFGSDPGSDIFYTYNADNNDESHVGAGAVGYGSVIPSLGVKMINTELDGFMGYKNSDPNSRITDPRISAHYLNALNYLWNDATPVTQYEDGYNPSSNDVTKYMYNGDIFNPNEWSARFPGPGLSAALPTDIRGIGVAEPFDLKPGEKRVIDIAIGVGLDSSNVNYLDNVTLMINNLNQAANYQRGLLSILPDPAYATCITGIDDKLALKAKKPSLGIYPNPSTGEISVLATENIESITLIDIQGKIVANFKADNVSNLQKISLPNSIPNGIYMVQAISTEGKLYSEKLMLQK